MVKWFGSNLCGRFFFGREAPRGLFFSAGFQYQNSLNTRQDAAPWAQQAGAPVTEVEKAPVGRQLGTLVRRYAKLIRNDPFRLALLIGQTLLLAILIAFVTGDGCFTIYENTKSCLFALSCAAFWVGILDSIQEICKERPIFQRETDGGIRVASYVLSKLVVLGVLCLVQAALFTATFCAFMSLFWGVGWTETGFMLMPGQLFATSAFIMLSAMCLGLFVSALFKNPNRAIACAPLLIMPQILFAGVVVELTGVVETISYFVSCRWGMSGYGTTAQLTTLNKSLVGKVVNGTEVKASWDLSALSPASDEAMYEQGIFGLFSAWSVMLVMCALFVGLCLLLLIIGTRKRHK
ncbi:MAG: ABC transporter permease [Atopobiaceae bacterium]|nr:ABC transporter permease [Atopobiaceae bacterium]